MTAADLQRRHMTGVQRYNARMEKIWEDARKLEAERLAKGERPNPNLTAAAIEYVNNPGVET